MSDLFRPVYKTNDDWGTSKKVARRFTKKVSEVKKPKANSEPDLATELMDSPDERSLRGFQGRFSTEKESSDFMTRLKGIIQ